MLISVPTKWVLSSGISVTRELAVQTTVGGQDVQTWLGRLKSPEHECQPVSFEMILSHFMNAKCQGEEVEWFLGERWRHGHSSTEGAF